MVVLAHLNLVAIGDALFRVAWRAGNSFSFLLVPVMPFMFVGEWLPIGELEFVASDLAMLDALSGTLDNSPPAEQNPIGRRIKSEPNTMTATSLKQGTFDMKP